MNEGSVMRKLSRIAVPASLRSRIIGSVGRITAPRMVYGYMDSSGVWRPRTRISTTTSMYCRERILIEDNVFVVHFTILDGTGGLEIGEGTQISSWAGLFSHSSHVSIRLYGKHYREVPESEKKGYRIGPVRTGKYVFIGVGAKILYGTSIGDGALVSLGSIVRGDVQSFTIVAGDPAEVMGTTSGRGLKPGSPAVAYPLSSRE